ncbi:MAG: WecB/TagA/CpsF family glycosyltransferase [Balneolaceae bacterium]
MIVLKKDHPYQVLGIDISSYKKDEFFYLIEQKLTGDGLPEPPLFVVTVNPEIVVQSIIDNEFRKILARSSINTADGIGIRWAVKFLYGKEVERITGSDSMETICRICAQQSQPVFLYGAMPGVVQKAADNLKEKIPNLSVSGTYSPDRIDVPFEELPADTQYYMSCASVIFVALGAPGQEKWIHENLKKLPNCKLIIGVGGSFDFIAGSAKRAPDWLCRSGLEWMYRLIREPSRWRRMIKLPLFALNVLLLKSSSKTKSDKKKSTPVQQDLAD